MTNILDYLDSQCRTNIYPEKFILPKEKIILIEKLLRESGIDNCYIDKKTNGLLNNYRGIPMEVKE
jgi:hypothetical protein